MVTFEGTDIVIRTEPPPRWIALLFDAVGLVLIGIALLGAFNIARVVAWAPQAQVSPSGLALGIGITTLILAVATTLLFAGLLPGRELRLDPEARRARLVVRRPLLTTRKQFAFDTLTAPRLVHDAEDAESSASWSFAMRLPDGTVIDYCAATLPLADQKRFAETWVARIAEMIRDHRPTVASPTRGRR